MTLTLEQFLATHGIAAKRIARFDDEVLHECLVIPFDEYVAAYDGIRGTVEGYVLMRLHYSTLKYWRKEYLRNKQHVSADDVPIAARDENSVISLELSQRLAEAVAKLDPDWQTTLALWIAGHSQIDIANMLGEDIRKVRARINASLHLLRKDLESEVLA